MVSLSIQTGKLGLEFFPLHHTDFPSRSDKLTFLQGLQQCYQPSFTKQSTFILRVKALQRKQKKTINTPIHMLKNFFQRSPVVLWGGPIKPRFLQPFCENWAIFVLWTRKALCQLKLRLFMPKALCLLVSGNPV